jgi:hypothetical protein
MHCCWDEEGNSCGSRTLWQAKGDEPLAYTTYKTITVLFLAEGQPIIMLELSRNASVGDGGWYGLHILYHPPYVTVVQLVRTACSTHVCYGFESHRCRKGICYNNDSKRKRNESHYVSRIENSYLPAN